MSLAEMMAEVRAGRETQSEELSSQSEPQQQQAVSTTGAVRVQSPIRLKIVRRQRQESILKRTYTAMKKIGTQKEDSQDSAKKLVRANLGITLTDRQKRQALRAYRFKVGRVSQPVVEAEERLAITRKLNNIIKQVRKIESHLKHKTSKRKQPRRPKKKKKQIDQNNCSEMHAFETDANKIPKHLKEMPLMDAARLLVATEFIMDNPPDALTDEYLMGTTYDEYSERFHFITASKSRAGSGTLNSPPKAPNPLDIMKRDLLELQSLSSSFNDLLMSEGEQSQFD